METQKRSQNKKCKCFGHKNVRIKNSGHLVWWVLMQKLKLNSEKKRTSEALDHEVRRVDPRPR